MSKTVAVALCALACVATVLAGTANPISLTAEVQLTLQPMNATNGGFYSYAVATSKISSFYEYRFQVQLGALSYVNNNLVKLALYWKMPDANSQLTWQAMTPTSYYEYSSDAVSSNGQLNIVVDPKQLYQGMRSYQVTPSEIQIGVLVSTTSQLPAVANGLFSITMFEVHAPQAQDGDVPFGSAGTEITGSCTGTMSRCMVVANMQYHNHRYLLASARVVTGNYYSVRMHNAAVLSFNDVSYFDGLGPVTVRTCLSNSSCAIEADYYYIEMRTTSQQSTSASYGVTLSQQASAFSTATASLFTVAAAAAAAYMAARSH